MSVKFITAIYSDLYGTELGGRPNRGSHYRFSLLSLLKMTDADFACYTSDREIESLKQFFYVENNISESKLKFAIYDIKDCKFRDLINLRKNVEEIKKGDNKYHTDQAGPKTMEPFPEKNILELLQGKIKIEQAKLRSLLVFGKLHCPIGGSKWRQRPRYYIPFGNRKSRAGQPGDTA